MGLSGSNLIKTIVGKPFARLRQLAQDEEGFDIEDLRAKLFAPKTFRTQLRELSSFKRVDLPSVPQPSRRTRASFAEHDSAVKSRRKAVRVVEEFFPSKLFHPIAMQGLLTNLDKIIALKSDTAAKGRENAYGEIHKQWDDAGRFIAEKEIISKIVGEEGKKPLEKEMTPHALTGFGSPFRTDTALALAHDYALHTNNPMTMIFGDVSNIGGTNLYFEKLLDSLQAKDSDAFGTLCLMYHIQPDDPKASQKASHKLTDWAVRIMMKEVREAFESREEALNKQVQFLGEGGDEFFITAPGRTEDIQKLIEKANTRVVEKVKELGLNDYPHTKENNSNLGLSVSFVSGLMNGQDGEDLKKLTAKSGDPAQAAERPDPYIPGQDQDEDVRRFEHTISQLTKDADLDPSSDKKLGVRDIMLADAKEPTGQRATKEAKLSFWIRKQLFNAFNESTGVQDVQVIPAYLESRVGLAKPAVMASVFLENISAINDNAKKGQEEGNRIQKLFGQRLRKYVREVMGIANAEVFSAKGPGKFYVVIPTKQEVDEIRAAIYGTAPAMVNEINNNEIVETKPEGEKKLGDLPNSKNKKLTGLYPVALVFDLDTDDRVDLAQSIDFFEEVIEDKTAAIRDLKEKIADAEDPTALKRELAALMSV